MYLPMFGVGTLIATEWPRLQSLANSVLQSRYRTLITTAAVTCGCILIYCYWIVLCFGNHVVLLRLTVPLATIGAALLILCVGFIPRIRHAISRPAFLWLGRISFSLYLTHEPIVIASGFLFAKLPPAVPIGISIALAFPVAWLFHRTIEVPSLRLAQWTGRRFGRVRPAHSQVDVAEGA
jgi:peptidoglycan/LPS O-acetylase OafA/YrhL